MAGVTITQGRRLGRLTPPVVAASPIAIFSLAVLAIPPAAAEALRLSSRQTGAWLLVPYGLPKLLSFALTLAYRQPLLVAWHTGGRLPDLACRRGALRGPPWRCHGGRIRRLRPRSPGAHRSRGSPRPRTGGPRRGRRVEAVTAGAGPGVLGPGHRNGELVAARRGGGASAAHAWHARGLTERMVR